MNDSTALLQWTPQLAVGLPEIDDEHRRLIDLINDVGRLHQRLATVDELRGALRELRAYAVYHFRTEELLMQRHAIDANFRRAHLAAHAGFVVRLDEFDALVGTDPPAVVECLMAFMVKWLVHHVTGVDARLARDIVALDGGGPASPLLASDGARQEALISTVSELYEGIAGRTLELLRANQLLQEEIERRQRAEEELRVAAIVFDAVDEAVMVTTAENRIIRVNPSFSRITGYSANEAIGANPRIMSAGTNPPEFYQHLWSTLIATGKWQGEIQNRRKNGELYVEWLSIYRVRDESSGVLRHVAVFSDITKQRVEAERIRYLANYDLLTGLPNRALLIDRLREELATGGDEGSRLALMFVDLDLFKSVNDALGHDVGDLLLRSAAQRMTEAVRCDDIVARHGGDEFVVMLPRIGGRDQAIAIAHELCERLRRPFELVGHHVHISCSVGIAVYPDHGSDELRLLKCADTAMYRAKLLGRDGVCYHDSDHA